jgi:Protein of unknown function (DUF1302)
MKTQKSTARHAAVFRRGAVALASAALFGATGAAHAFQLDFGPDSDWKGNFDNTVQYVYGVRAGGVDPKIGNNPAYAESDYRFPNKGDVVTNRLSLLSEFDAVYKGRAGVRLSASLWKDAAYNDTAKTNPGWAIAPGALGPNPGTPYSSNYTNSQYSSYTKRWQIEGGELREAFVFANFDLGERPSNLKAGRLTEYWGNSLFFSAAGIAYSQSGVDGIKALSVPGTQAKELSLPRGQISFSTQVADEVQFGAQYFVESQQDRMPSGGTYLGLADFLFEGPDSSFAFGGAPRMSSGKPKDINDNFGLQLKWSPQWLAGTLGAYYRQFDETASAGPLFGIPVIGGVPTLAYALAYPEKTKLVGFSLDKQILGASVGVEVTYRQNTALNTSAGALIGAAQAAAAGGNFYAPDSSLVARGDTLNVVVNAVSVLDRTPLYNTGNLVAELGMVKKLRVTSNEAFYNGEGTAACIGAGLPAGAADGRNTGCSSDTAFMVAGLFEPQWLQVFPGVDLSAPLYAMYGLSGNAASNGISVKEGDLMYAVGVKALVKQRYNFTLQYNGYDGRSVGTTNYGAAGGVPNVPGVANYSAAGNNLFQFKDRNWLSFTFAATF